MILRKYTNGNYKVLLLNNGTKVRYTNDDKFMPEFPENIDIKLTNNCPYNCEFCHENSSPTGESVDIKKLWKKLSDLALPSDIELALGGGALSTINNFKQLIISLPQITNITINQKELNNIAFFNQLVWLSTNYKNIFGIGISFNDMNDQKSILRLKQLSSAAPDSVVYHTIYGITTKEEYEFLYNKLHAQKVLVLGYKNFRRGEVYKSNHLEQMLENQKSFDKNLSVYREKFPTLSFDCLAVEQLNLKDKISDEDWNKYYMGDDGQFTMYIDLVKNEFAKNSSSSKRYKIQSGQTIRDLFKIIREEK